MLLTLQTSKANKAIPENTSKSNNNSASFYAPNKEDDIPTTKFQSATISSKGDCSNDPLQLIMVLVVPHDYFGWNTPSSTSIYWRQTRVEATSSPLFDFAAPPNSFRSCWYPYELNDRCLRG